MPGLRRRIGADSRSAWMQIRDDWESGWRDLYADGLSQYGSAVKANPKKYAGPVEAAIRSLTRTEQRLGAMAVVLGDKTNANVVTNRDLANYGVLRGRYNQLAAGIYADSRPAEKSEGMVGAVPVVPILVVIGIAILTIGAICFCVVAWHYISELEAETQLQHDDLMARLELARKGKTLPPSTIPRDGKGGGYDLVGIAALGVLAAGAVGLFYAARGS